MHDLNRKTVSAGMLKLQIQESVQSDHRHIAFNYATLGFISLGYDIL